MEIKKLLEELDTLVEPKLGELNDNFKRWFGNSKVVDDKGNPLVCYHGSTVDIDEFDITYSGNNTGNNVEEVFYFTSDEDTAITYSQQAHVVSKENDYYDNGGTSDGWQDFVNDLEEKIADNPNINPCFLRIENPYIYDADYSDFDARKNYTMIVMIKGMEKIDPDLFDEGLQEELLEEWYEYDEDEGYILKPECDFDGVIIKNVRDNITDQNTDYIDEYIVWDPKQIKSIYNKGLWDLYNANVYESVCKRLNKKMNKYIGR